MSEDNSKFIKPNGDLTKYAFLCGHVQENKEFGVAMYSENFCINLYSIKYNGKWDQATGLGNARSMFKRIVKNLQKQKEKNDNISASQENLPIKEVG